MEPAVDAVVPLIPFPSYLLASSDRPGAVQGAPAGAAERTLDGQERSRIVSGEGKGILARRPTQNPEEPIFCVWKSLRLMQKLKDLRALLEMCMSQRSSDKCKQLMSFYDNTI